MHTANRLSRLSSTSGKLKQWSRVVLPGLFVISAILGASLTEARRGDGAEGRGAVALKVAPVSAVAAATITVNDAGDTISNNGKCTLREAITAANTNTASGATAGECAAGMAGADNIVFDLGTGTPTINLSSALPAITEPVTIKGNTGGATRVELNGAGAGANANGLTISAGNSLIERLVINRFTGDGVRITGAGFNTVKGCIIGLDSSGTIVRANNVGLAIRGSSDNTIGSIAIPDRNAISGNTTDGVLITSVTITNPPPNPPTVTAASRNKIINSYIGPDITGRFDLGNTGFGINISGGDATVIGGATMEERNVISGNNGGGVRIGTSTATNNKVIGNYIGTDATGIYALGNGVSGGGGTAPGVWIDDAPNNFVGGTVESTVNGILEGEFNYIKYNLQNGGVVVTGSSATGNSILRNYIYGNAGLGIDLGNNGVTANDLFDGDSGPNNLQNSPVLNGVSFGTNSMTIFGSLNSQSLQNYRIEFFFSTQCDSSGSGEGETYIGFTNVSTDIFGGVSFSPTFNNFAAPAGTYLTATATHLGGSQNTSEFSGCFLVPGGGPTTCTPAFLPQSGNFRTTGGTASISVYLAPGCAWTATSNLSWVTIQSGASGVGSGMVMINVAPNSGTQRLGQINIAGQNYNISQEGPCTSSLNPPIRNFTAAGGNGIVELITGSGCPWTISNANSWITINSASSGSGPTFVEFSVDPYTGTVPRVGLVIIGGQNFAVFQDQPCGSTIDPTSQMAAAGGGNYSVNVTIPAGCNWTATTTDTWITLTGATSGTGNGTVTYSVAANSGTQRGGVIMVAGKNLVISQDSGCQPTFDPTTQTIGAGSGSHSFNVNIGPACNWTPTTTDAWITITSPSRTGNGSVNYTVTANPGSQRIGTITVQGVNFAVVQDGACSYMLSKTVHQFPVQGGTDSVSVSAPGGCPWTASSQTPWIVITSGASGSGNGTVNYLVATNGSGSQRAGVMNVAGTNFIVQQEGGCTYTVSPLSQNAPASGGAFTTSVSAAGGCAWTASSNDSWITITSSLLPNRLDQLSPNRIPSAKNGIAGTGNGTVGYTVAANTGPARVGTLFAAGELVTVTQASGCPINISPSNLTAGQVGVNYSQQLTQSGGVGTITWSVSSGSLPPGLMLNPSTGLLSGMPTVPASFSFTVRATDSNNCYGDMPYLLVINCQPLSISPASLPNGVALTIYNQQLTLNGGGGATDWLVSAGTLPPGMSLNPTTGILSGLPSGGGTFNFTVKATVNSTGCFTTQAYTLVIGCQAIGIDQTSLNAGTLGVAYSQQLTQTGGVGNITWSLSSGMLPTGVSLSPGGLLSGTPAQSGSFPITIKATDANGCFGEKNFSLSIGCPGLNITPASLSAATNGSPYSEQLSQTGATGSVTWSLSVGTLPNNLTLSPGGLISGTPTVPGSFPITVRATDSGNSCFTDKAYTLTVNCQAIGITPATLNAGTFGAVYSQQLAQTGGVGAVGWSISAGSLPGGLMLNPSNGLLSGTPTATGTFNFTVRATDTNNCFGEQAYQLVINCQSLSISPSALNPIPIATPYSQQLALTGGGGATDWTVTAGALPSGVTLHPTSGLLSGTPNVSGTFNFTVKATLQSTGCFAQQAYTLVVNCPTINVSPATINPAFIGVPYSQQFSQTGGAGNVTWTLSSGSLPNNLTLSPSGLLSGTPVMSGNYLFTVRATDGNGCFGEQSYGLQVATCPAVTLTPATLPNGLINTNYNETLTAVGGNAPYIFTVGSGLPSGVSLSTAGVLSGAPVVVGTFNFTVRATDVNGCFGEQAYTLFIGPPCGAITVNPPTLPSGFVGTVYPAQTFSASGGNGPITFSLDSGTLPAGLNLVNGVLSGTPTVPGAYGFTIKATDNNGCTGTQSYTVNVAGGGGLMFYPLPVPVRLLDTRPGENACDMPGQPIAAGTERLQIARRTCGVVTIPAEALAITGNVTPVPGAAGFLTLFPSSATRPLVSNSNFSAGEVVNNVFTVGLGLDGGFKIYSHSTTHVIVDVTGYYAPPGAGGLYFHPLPKPIRLLETRQGEAGCDTPGMPIGSGQTRTQPGRISCDGITIPAAAQALVGNVTTILPPGPGFLTLYPAGTARPLVSSGNYAGGDVVNTPFTVGLGAGGEFDIYAASQADMAVDVIGYYSTEALDGNGTGLLFTPLGSPVRLLETRQGQPGCFNPGAPLAGGSETTQQARGTCAGQTVPAGALAIVGNATVVQAQAGFLTLWPNGAARPLASSLNFATGQTANRHVTVGLGADGVFRIYTHGTTDLVIDLSGYFAP